VPPNFQTKMTVIIYLLDFDKCCNFRAIKQKDPPDTLWDLNEIARQKNWIAMLSSKQSQNQKIAAAFRTSWLDYVLFMESEACGEIGFWDKMLQSACFIGNEKMIQYAVENGANLDVSLPYACRGANMKIVKKMIKYGAVPHMNALLAACKGGNIAIVRYISSFGDYIGSNRSAMMCAGQGGNIEIFDFIVARGTHNFSYAFTCACRAGRTDLVKHILFNYDVADHHIDIDNGLFVAGINNKLEVCKIMIKMSASKYDIERTYQLAKVLKFYDITDYLNSIN